MKKKTVSYSLTICCLLGLVSKGLSQSIVDNVQSVKIANELQVKDSVLFDIIFHTCDVQKLSSILSKDFTMLHDNGLSNPTVSQSYPAFNKSIQTLCERKAKGLMMRRQVVPGSLQIFLRNPNEALQTGVQRFYSRRSQGGEELVEESKFMRNWRKERGSWKIYNETDYLVNTNPVTSASERYIPDPYVPASHELYSTIVKLDSLYFDTYNHSKPAEMDSLTASDIEFYHDRGGLTTSKRELLESIRKNIFGKVTRILTKNSIEVYEIPNYGAVEFGYHSFRNIAEAGESHPSKFVIIWRLKDRKWQLARVVSLH